MKTIEILNKMGEPVARVSFPENTLTETVLEQIKAYSSIEEQVEKEATQKEIEATAWEKFKSWFSGQ